MAAKLAKALARSVVYNIPLLHRTAHAVRNWISPVRQVFRNYKNMHSLLAELDSDVGLQVPILVEQNRKLFRELEQIKKDLEMIRKNARNQNNEDLNQ